MAWHSWHSHLLAGRCFGASDGASYDDDIVHTSGYNSPIRTLSSTYSRPSRDHLVYAVLIDILNLPFLLFRWCSPSTTSS